ncbi:hypothetical protein EYC84_001231 [Monilinia fructicola]|uniref:Uncharacterized protein n=1 Tax=Monilinia fructicola TaxID=38448 RepID=A0A5M9JP94_MONFR|nr:hypothetical protein EYC84_001231 [Monilinia fructicola]
MSASESSTLHANSPHQTNQTSSKTDGSNDIDADVEDSGSGTAKLGKRRLFGFGRKKNDEKTKGKKKDDGSLVGNAPLIQPPQQTPTTNSPPRSSYPYQYPSSPPSRKLFSSSPRVVSPAGSQIFERDVQESTLQPNSPAIPSHIQTEDHIPPTRIQWKSLCTPSHQPAAMSMTAGGIGSNEPSAGMWTDDLVAHPDKDDAASNYGALDSTDIRRLSFISFADVVQSEHAEHAGNRDSIYIAGLSALSSPVSSFGFGTSPPTSKSASVKGVDLSPVRKQPGLASPTSLHSPTNGGELTIEKQ